MKKLLLLIFTAMLYGNMNAQQVFYQESFEDTNGWTMSHSFVNTFGDYFLRDTAANFPFTNAISNVDSTFIIGAEDTQNSIAGAPSDGVVYFTIDSVDISSKASLSVIMAIAANGGSNYDQCTQSNGDSVLVEAKIDNGAYQRLAFFCSAAGSNNPILYQDTSGNKIGEATEPALAAALSDFSFNVSGTGSYMTIKVTIRMDSGSEEVAFDNVRVSGVTVCSDPSALGASNIDTTSADLTWTTGGASNAVIQYGANGFTLGQGTHVSVTSSPYSLTGLTPATTYQFYVKDSCSSSSVSNWVGPFSFTTQSNTCNSPQSLNALVLDTSVNLTWVTGGATAWNIQYGASGFTLGNGTMITNTSSNPYQINGLMPGTAYDFYVQDTCGAALGASAWTGPYTRTTLAQPSVVSASIVNSTTIMVVFSDSMDFPTVTDLANYGGIGGLNGVTINFTRDTMLLTYSSAFPDGIVSTLTISDAILSDQQIKLDTNYSFDFLFNGSTPALVITEIMYNDASSSDSLEFIEIYNNGIGLAEIGGLSFNQGFDFIFPAGSTMNPGDFIVVAANSSAVNSVFGLSSSFEWTGGGLSNSGEDISLVNSLDSLIDYVDYDDRSPWDEQADGAGTALVLCDVNEDNNSASSWWRETNEVAGHRTSPGAANSCWPANYSPALRTIAEMKTVDSTGVVDSLNRRCALEGTVFTPDFDGNSGYSFFMYDSTGGINVFEFGDVSNYSVKLGDKIRGYGYMIQFNGLAEFRVDSIQRLDSNLTIKEPTDVQNLSESTESEFIRLRNVTLADTNDWRTSGSFNFQVVTSAGDTLNARVDSDTDVSGTWTSAPKGTFDLTGVGQQFDNSSPYTDGYQIFPRFATDIDTTLCAEPSMLALDNVDSTSATVSWSGPSQADLQYGLEGFSIGNGTMMDTVTSPYTITGLDDTTSYEFYVRQVCATKTSAWAGPFAFRTTQTGAGVGQVETIRSTSDFKVFPNPVNGSTVKFNRSANIRVMDVLGNFLMNQENATKLDVSDLSSGVYFIVESEGNVVKLIVE